MCELWLNPWVYCFRHALTTSPQRPGSRLHSSQGGPPLTQRHSLPSRPAPDSFSPSSISSCAPPPLYPPSPCYSTLPLLSNSLNISFRAVLFPHKISGSRCSFFVFLRWCQQKRNRAGVPETQVLCSCQLQHSACLNSRTSWSGLSNQPLCR